MGVANAKTRKTVFLLQGKYQLESDPPNLLFTQITLNISKLIITFYKSGTDSLLAVLKSKWS